MAPPGTVGAALQAAQARLRDAGVPDAGRDARRLMAHAFGLVPGRLTLVLADPIGAPALDTFRALVERRLAREPVSHLTGFRLFWGREFEVTRDVLDPRPETEVLVAAALEEPFARVLDLGTGSGCLLVTLLAERPEAEGLGVDASEAALAVASRNARRHGVAGRAALVRSDWFDAVPGAFDLVVSNPPYVALAEMAALAPEVRDHEPRLALTDEGDGLGAHRAILAGARRHLAPNGQLLLEIGPTQAGEVARIGMAHGFPQPQVVKDLDGRNRACLFRAGAALKSAPGPGGAR